MIELRGIGKSYGSGRERITAIGSVDLTIGAGEFVSIVGPSGCGKSTILNMIAGFLPPTAGQIRVNGKPVVEGRVPEGLGYIFQKDTVLPWLDVAKNIGLGLRYRGRPKAEIDAKVTDLLNMAGLAGYGGLFPHQLSGGMRQRVSLLMTLACDPKVLLLDEPFGALDTHTKIVLHKELLEIWRRLGQTIVLVTHDLDEAITLSNRVVVLSSPPSRVALDHEVTIPHPRDVFSVRESDAFSRNFQAVWHVLGEEFRRNQAFDHVAHRSAA
ncbi:ABC transporter ATP-binding protein [uncultured Enterovirga sp.]|uniref:ABC transporter ATP-binding protein n=1 Tax=uncultured Enterovirga sp. TaxID=2026352 RepID=UPI0035C95874